MTFPFQVWLALPLKKQNRSNLPRPSPSLASLQPRQWRLPLNRLTVLNPVDGRRVLVEAGELSRLETHRDRLVGLEEAYEREGRCRVSRICCKRWEWRSIRVGEEVEGEEIIEGYAS